MRGGDQLLFVFAPHLEIEPHRFRAKATDVNAYFQQIVEPRRATKVTFQMHARQPDLEFIKHVAVGQSDFAKQLRFSKLKEVNVRSEEHTSERQSQSNLVCRLLLEKK